MPVRYVLTQPATLSKYDAVEIRRVEIDVAIGRIRLTLSLFDSGGASAPESHVVNTGIDDLAEFEQLAFSGQLGDPQDGFAALVLRYLASVGHLPAGTVEQQA